MSDKIVEVASVDEIRALNARVLALESENSSLKDDIADLERELEFFSMGKVSNKKKSKLSKDWE